VILDAGVAVGVETSTTTFPSFMDVRTNLLTSSSTASRASSSGLALMRLRLDLAVGHQVLKLPREAFDRDL
jgi:hypothetical protein